MNCEPHLTVKAAGSGICAVSKLGSLESVDSYNQRTIAQL